MHLVSFQTERTNPWTVDHLCDFWGQKWWKPWKIWKFQHRSRITRDTPRDTQRILLKTTAIIENAAERTTVGCGKSHQTYHLRCKKCAKITDFLTLTHNILKISLGVTSLTSSSMWCEALSFTWGVLVWKLGLTSRWFFKFAPARSRGPRLSRINPWTCLGLYHRSDS